MKNILLPTDFSENAWNAIFTAVKLYRNFPCRFYLFHSYQPQDSNLRGFKSSVRAGSVYEAMEEVAKTELAKTVAYLKENHSNPNHLFETVSCTGDLVEGIQKMVSKYDIETIVMGTKGTSGPKGIFIGTNTVKVLKSIKNCVLLAVPLEFDFKSLCTVVLPTEFTHFFPKHVLLPLLELVGSEQCEIKVFHVAQEFKLGERQQANKAILKKRLEKFNHTFYKVNITTSVAQAIREFSKEQKADLIVLTNYSHTFLEKMTQEPVVTKVAFKTNIPLMVLPDFEG